MPNNVVPGNQTKYPVSFYYSGDPGPYPIPANVNIEGGSDRHAILIDNTNCVLYELFNLTGGPTTWGAGSGAIWSLNSNAMRPDNQNSADAAGLQIFPGLVRPDEVAAGHINHALRVTIDHTRQAHIWPARSSASYRTEAIYPPMGQRFRLKASYNISTYPQPVQVILQALKTYGMILADNGTSWHLGGIGGSFWNDDVMHTMTLVTGDNFEAVDESSLMKDPNSMETSVPTTVPTGWVNVIAKNSSKCLDMTGGPAATWQTDPVQQWACLGSQQTNQIFQLTPVTGGYKVIAKNSGLSLQPTGGTSSVRGSILEAWPYEGQPYQIWTVTPTADGYFSIRNASNKFCMDVTALSTANGAPIHQWDCTANDNQKWSLVPVQ